MGEGDSRDDELVTPKLCESVVHARHQQVGVLVGLGHPEEAAAWSAALHEIARAVELLEPYGARTIGITPAFRKYAARNHPDKGGDAEDFKLVQGMLRVLELPTFDWLLFGIHGAVAVFSFAVRAGLLEKWCGEAGVEAAASGEPATHALVALPDNSVECWELHDLEIVPAPLYTSLTCFGCLPSTRSPPSFPKSLDFQPQSFEDPVPDDTKGEEQSAETTGGVVVRTEQQQHQQEQHPEDATKVKEGPSEQLSSDESDALRARGNAAYQAGNLDEAREIYTHAISLDPSGASAHLLHSNLSAVYASLKEWNLSLLHASKCVDLDPHFAKGWSRMGAAHEQLEQFVKSVGAYRLCHLLDPDNMNAARAAERLEPSAGALCSAGAAAAVSGAEAFDEGEHKAAVAFITAAITTLGGHFFTDTAAQLFCNRAAAHASDNNFSLALLDAAQAVLQRPRWPQAHALKGRALRGLRQYDLAAASYRAALALDPSDDGVSDLLCVCLREAGEAPARGAPQVGGELPLPPGGAIRSSKRTQRGGVEVGDSKRPCFGERHALLSAPARVGALEGDPAHMGEAPSPL